MHFKEAEATAQAWMRDMGFVGARLTQAGADGGVDVTSEAAVAQVKAVAKPTGRPEVQRIHGVASNTGKQALFFSTAGFTGQASDWADEAGVALFTIEPSGAISSSNVHARRVITNRQVTAKEKLGEGSIDIGGEGKIAGDVDVGLAFTITECDFCGHDSPKSVGCQQCGQTPPEDDPHVTNRRRAVEAALARVHISQSTTSSATPEDLFRRLDQSQVMERHAALLSGIDGADANWQSSYAECQREFATIRNLAMTSSARSASKWAAAWPQLDQVIQSTADAMQAFERGATASTPDLAATYFEQANQAIAYMVGSSRQTTTAPSPRTLHSPPLLQETRSGCLGALLVVIGIVLLMM